MAILGIRVWHLAAHRELNIPGLPDELAYRYGITGAFYGPNGEYLRGTVTPESWWPLTDWIRATCVECARTGRDILNCKHWHSEGTGYMEQLPRGIYAFHADRWDCLLKYLLDYHGQLLSYLEGIVIGQVELAGMIQVHELGYRAEYARVRALAGPDDNRIYLLRLGKIEPFPGFPEVPVWRLNDQQLQELQQVVYRITRTWFGQP